VSLGVSRDGCDEGVQTCRRSAIAAVISAMASAIGTPFFYDPSR